MEFKKVEDRHPDLYERIELDGVEIGIYPVMFGYRVRVGYVGRMSSELDLCGGDNLEMIDLLYNGCRLIVEGQHRMNVRDSRAWFKPQEFPEQNVKPFYKDLDFLGKFCDLITRYRKDDIANPEMKVTRDKLDKARQTQMKLIWFWKDLIKNC